MKSHKFLAGWLTLVVLLAAGVAAVAPDVARAQGIVAARCGACNGIVPNSSKVGDICPHCRVRWGTESSEYVPGGSYTYGSQPSPQEIYSWQEWQRREARAAVKQERADRLREQQLARRETLRARSRELTAAFRRNDDPEQRAERYVTAGIHCEQEDDFDSAAAYYRLTIRSLPDTLAASQAQLALNRIGGQDGRPSFSDPRPLARVAASDRRAGGT